MKSRRQFLSLAALMLAMTLAVATMAQAYPRPSTITFVQTRKNPSHTVHALQPAISLNHRFVAFQTFEALLPEDLNTDSDIYVRDLKTNRLELISKSPQGLSAGGSCLNVQDPDNPIAFGSHRPFLSATGRYVVFQSCAADLVPGDTNLAWDVFVADRKTDVVRRVSVSSSGEETPTGSDSNIGWGNARQLPQVLSANGQRVVFVSDAPNLVPEDNNENADVFLHDLRTRLTIRVSVWDDGSETSRGSLVPGIISADGRYVAFTLIEDGSTFGRQLIVREVQRRKNTLANPDVDGNVDENPLGGVLNPSISADGKVVAWISGGYRYVPNDTNNVFDIFVRDLSTKRTERISVSSAGEESGAVGTFLGGATRPSVSADGRYVAFKSQQDELIDNDTNGVITDIFIHDRLTGSTLLVSKGPDGKQAGQPPVALLGGEGSSDMQHTADGRYIVFQTFGAFSEDDQNGTERMDVYVVDLGSELGIGNSSGDTVVRLAGSADFEHDGYLATEDVVGDVPDGIGGPDADIIGARVAYRPASKDIYLRIDVDRLSGPPGAAGNPAILHGVRFTVGDDRYEVRIARVGQTGTVGRPAFGLFRCDGRGCLEVAQLRGGHGTVGQNVVTAIPLQEIGLEHGGTIGDAVAFSAFGTYELGVRKILDRASFARSENR